jgi:threonine/homoserine/homoserine lactone efflux protein
MVSLVGFGIGATLGQSAVMYEMLKIIGIVYLLYLAYKIYGAGSVQARNVQKNH